MRINFCGRCGKSNVREIHTCTPTEWARKMETKLAQREHLIGLQSERINELESFNNVESESIITSLRNNICELMLKEIYLQETIDCVLKDRGDLFTEFLQSQDIISQQSARIQQLMEQANENPIPLA